MLKKYQNAVKLKWKISLWNIECNWECISYNNLALNKNIALGEVVMKKHNLSHLAMEQLNAICYISDIDTYELLYLNELGKKSFGVEEMSNLISCFL